MKRPVGFTLLALLFAWLALGGFGFAWASPRTDPAQVAALGLRVPVMVAIGLLYGGAASAAAVALWRVAAWAPRAILIWGGCLVAGMVAFQAMIGIAGEPWWLVLLPHLMFGALVLALFRYVERRTKSFPQAI